MDSWGWLGCDKAEVQQFIAEADRAGIDSVLEVVVREADGSSPAPGRRAELLVEAVKQTAPPGATLYETEVPYCASAEHVTGVSAPIPDGVKCQWDVLPSGVAGDQFPQAVQCSTQGGAEGFLVGRAVWGNATAMDGEASTNYLNHESVAIMARLRESLRAGRFGVINA